MNTQISAKLITYNRADRLAVTLSAWNACGLRDIPLEILDNSSTDGTCEVIAEAMRANPGITLFRHKLNIGAAGNLMRAYERFDTQYCWVLCDDDEFNPLACEELFSALKSLPEMLLVADLGLSNKDKGYFGSVKDYVNSGGAFYLQAGFLPGLIFRREFLLGNTLFLCNRASSCLYPHAVLLDKLANQALRLIVLSSPLVIRRSNEDIKSIEIYWLYETIYPTRFMSSAGRRDWVYQFMVFGGERDLLVFSKRQCMHRARGALTLSRALEIRALIRDVFPLNGLLLVLIALVPAGFFRCLLTIWGHSIPEKDRSITSQRL